MPDLALLRQADLRAMGHHVLFNEPFRLVLFTIPKAGCTELIRLMRRLGGARDWSDAPHHKPDRPLLKDLGLERVTKILDDPRWTKAVVLRDPAERLLSAYLDKFVYAKSYAADLFRPAGRGMPFDEFLGYVLAANRDPSVPMGLHEATDPHWRPQLLVGPIQRVESAIGLVGDFAEVGQWIEQVLRRVGAWERFGASGWGSNGAESIFETNTDPRRTDAARRMSEFYRPETLEAVYCAYAGDLALASRAGIDLVKHDALRI